ncbi:iron-containing alcohol dehydrogenase [Streptomyces sp. NPDC093089]|uniref:iron-containing alcohol dehydrogenase n=1 Tax=Streptomyces sp. NPDC093089 TaxID=3366024 RepID=UPI00381937E3
METEEMADGLVRDALAALDRFETFDQEQVDHIVRKASLAALSAHGDLAKLAVEETGRGDLAKLAVEETGRGLFEDKAVKNLFACEHVTHSMAGLKTAGVIRRDELNGITEIAEPVGVVCAMTPVTNPTSTTVFKALIALKTRNPIVFAFHPSAQKRSAEAARIVRAATVRAGAAAMRDFRPDTIIALGGGSPMDAAKVMWLMYERPEVEFADTKEKSFDIRKRAYRFPKLGEKAKLVAIPTTSGTGSEVTPFAVVSDPEAAQKYPLADYALTPDVAIVDPVLPMDLPATVTADSGFDALTHATEAYVSAYADDSTDGQCLQAIKLVLENLETCVTEGAAAPEAREKMHNASTIAGMAFANAFLGLVHAMAHTPGNTFRVAHGRTNALLLPHVVRPNGTVTHKAVPWPKAEVYRAPERYQEIARMLGLPAATPEEGVESYARAVEELRTRCGIPASFREEGVDEAAFLAALPQQAMNAYADQCAPANPRMPMIDEMKELMTRAYYGA